MNSNSAPVVLETRLKVVYTSCIFSFFRISAVTKFSTKFTSLGYFFLHCSSSLEPHIAPCHSPHKPILFAASLWACTDIYKLWSTMQLYGFIDPFFSSWKWHFLSIWLARKPKVTKIEAIWPFLIVSLWGVGTASFASYLNFVVLSPAINTTWLAV